MGEADSGSVTIYDIAREAGVSPATVSRVLTGSANVSAKKRTKVNQIIKKYNFKPNILAKGLSESSSKTIGIIVADVRNSYCASLFVECEEQALKSGYMLSLYNSFSLVENEIEQLDMLSRQKVDAVIQIGGRIDAIETDVHYRNAVRSLANTIPFVTTRALTEDIPHHSVEIDDVYGMDIVMKHLMSQGHREIALICGSDSIKTSLDKRNCYKEILVKNGIGINNDYIIDGDFTIEAGYAAMQKILSLSKRPTAIIAINDSAAAGALKAIYEAGLRVPQDFAVVSYDNTYIARVSIPELTSVDYDYAAYGKCLTDTAIAAARGEDVPARQILRPSLVVRASSME